MEISGPNIHAFLLDANQCIEDHAENAVYMLFEERNLDFLGYPPNAGFTAAEQEELSKLANNPHLANALRKLIADSSASVVFDLLNLLDGTSEPFNALGNWTGLQLVNRTGNDDKAAHHGEMLHDHFFAAYWDWKAKRPQKDWRLDTAEE